MVNVIEHYWQDKKSHTPSTYITRKVIHQRNEDYFHLMPRTSWRYQLKVPAGALTFVQQRIISTSSVSIGSNESQMTLKDAIPSPHKSFQLCFELMNKCECKKITNMSYYWFIFKILNDTLVISPEMRKIKTPNICISNEDMHKMKLLGVSKNS